MGHAFAANLVDDGYEVSVYDRDAARAAAVHGATAATRLGDLAGCRVVLTSGRRCAGGGCARAGRFDVAPARQSGSRLHEHG
jgi:hypothetical protein